MKMYKLTFLVLTSLLLIGCQESKLDKNLDNMQNVMSNTKSYKDLRDTTNNSIKNAKQYEMNVLSSLAVDEQWDILNSGDSDNSNAKQPKGEYTKEALQSITGETVEEAKEKYSKMLDEEKEGLATSEKLLISDISIRYYTDLDGTSLIQVFNIISDIYTKEVTVVWKEGMVVDYVETL